MTASASHADEPGSGGSDDAADDHRPGPLPGHRDRGALILANALLGSYVLDAGITLVDELLIHGTSTIPVTMLRTFFATTTVWLSAAWLLMAWLWVRGPVRLFTLMAASTLWLNWTLGAPLGVLFFDPWESGAQFRVLAVIQTGIAATVLLIVRRRHGCWWIPASVLAPERWPLRRRIGRGLVHGVIGGTALVLFAPFLLANYLQQSSGGWVWLRWDGVYLRDASYVDEAGRHVRLVALAHVGERGAYERVMRSFEVPETLILEEGVSDRTGLIGPPSSDTDGRFVPLPAAPHALVPQPGLAQFLPLQRLDPLADEPRPVRADLVAVMNADIDVSEFSDSTRAVLRKYGDALDAMLELEGWSAILAPIATEDEATMFREVLAKRDRALLAHLDDALAHVDRVIIPWGAMHMPGITAGLARRGFRPAGPPSSHRLLSWQTRRLDPARANPALPHSGIDPTEQPETWLRDVLARLYADAEIGWVFEAGEAEPEPASAGGLEVESTFGGLPTRFPGERWPRSATTDRPMSFVAEIVRTKENAHLLGRVDRLRVFVDHDGFFGDDERDAYAVRITTVDDPHRSAVPWEADELAALAADFGTSEYGAVLHGTRRIVAGSLRKTVFVPWIEAPEDEDPSARRAWSDLRARVAEESAAAHPEVIEPYARSVLGGRPYWVQWPDPQRLPFLLQLYPDEELMWADGAHLYLFLDPERPERGHILLGQSH